MRLAIVAVMLAATPAFADDEKAKPIVATVTPSPEPIPAGRIVHTGQFGVSLRLGIGLRAIAPYDKAVYCGVTDTSTSTGYAPVCVGRSPFTLDLEFAYGLRDRLDAFVELRFGIEGDFGSSPIANDGPHQVAVSPGVRFFFSEAKRSKLFSTAQVVLDFTDYKGSDGIARSSDFGLRNLNGIWFEINQSYSAYLYAGETLTFVRWLGFELEGGVGFQARY